MKKFLKTTRKPRGSEVTQRAEKPLEKEARE